MPISEELTVHHLRELILEQIKDCNDDIKKLKKDIKNFNEVLLIGERLSKLVIMRDLLDSFLKIK